MADPNSPASKPSEPSPPSEFQAGRSLFHSSSEPLFILNQHRRLLAVNRALETLLQRTASEVCGLICSRTAASTENPLGALAHALFPPAPVYDNLPMRVRRQVTLPSAPSQCWEIDFLPIRDPKRRLRILGKISLLPADSAPVPAGLSERAWALRDGLDQRYSLENLTSVVPSVQRIELQVRLASQSHFGAFIIGEPGSGKEWVARTIHQLGSARHLFFVGLDCEALPPTALEASLFGDRGLLSNVAVGTLLLKEVHALPRDLQARMLDFTEQHHEKSPRLLGATSLDPNTATKAAGLLPRFANFLSAQEIRMPPLRDRRTDLGWFVDRMLTKLSKERKQPVARLSAKAWALFQEYSWPRNLDELYGILSSAVHRAKNEVIEHTDLPSNLRLSVVMQSEAIAAKRSLNLDAILQEIERRLIVLALRQSKGNKSRAAEQLSIWRQRLVRRMETLGIEPDSSDIPFAEPEISEE